ncbi:hypothetical protein [Ralstonia sp. 1B3]|uniref:hypothetical protein n=1 Tax=Ralstonia sp. 1B3 TaxID=2997421 RepID=UPI002FC59A38
MNDTFTLDLREVDELQSEHLAFSMDRALFDTIHARLVERGIAYGGSPFDRRSGQVGQSFARAAWPHRSTLTIPTATRWRSVPIRIRLSPPRAIACLSAARVSSLR